MDKLSREGLEERGRDIKEKGVLSGYHHNEVYIDTALTLYKEIDRLRNSINGLRDEYNAQLEREERKIEITKGTDLTTEFRCRVTGNVLLHIIQDLAAITEVKK